MNSWVFYTLQDNLILLCFVGQIVLALAIRSSLTWLLCSFDIPFHYGSVCVCVCVCVCLCVCVCYILLLNTSILSGTTKYSKLILVYSLSPSWNQPFLQEVLAPFSRELYWKPKSRC